MAEYIDKEAAMLAAMDYEGRGNAQDASMDIASAIGDIPAADVRENVGAHWIRKHDDVCYWSECSACGERQPLNRWRQEWESPFCPACRKKMEVQDG